MIRLQLKLRHRPHASFLTNPSQGTPAANAKRSLSSWRGHCPVLLGFVGLLNFVNILSASIVRRKVEFAILESIGMTKRQLRQQVIYEGASYAIIAILLFSTLGTTLTLILLNVFSSQVSYALCRYPVLPTLLIVIALILLSAVIPTILFQCSRKTSLIDRLRSVE